ncbi:Meprin A subunit beta [Goodea atripinnis]|uniref:Metalloendopeptidase n=1 Tax=Goodea atripinnis TaxID=208336 RepID=A0ABV0MVQ2_9TELE
MILRWIILMFGLGLTTAKLTGETETDVDQGQEWDIFDINGAAGLDLLEGDIEQDEIHDRNSIIGDKYRWPTTIPYYLEDSLDINAKGVILKAFDQYRLKTCIDFTPWKGEEHYISVFKGNGCYSSVGNRRIGKQQLSIGANCDTLGTVEHEFLHALGFWHEQSRADRDDYVNIIWEQIEPGKEHNFNTYDDTVSDALGVPYDYGSVMHYSKTAFSINSEPTMITKIPQFTDVIGQRMGFSASDLTKLNLLYNCTKTSTFVDSCDFEEDNICGMIPGSGPAMWEQRSSVSGGPQTDVTNMGQCKGDLPVITNVLCCLAFSFRIVEQLHDSTVRVSWKETIPSMFGKM